MKPLFRKEVYKQRDQKLQGEIRVARPPSFVWLTWLITGFVLLSAIFLFTGDYARKEGVQGLIEPDAGVLEIRPDVQGYVQEVLVEEGERVEKGQALLRISGERFLAAEGAINQALTLALEYRIDRIENRIKNENRRHELHLDALKNQIESTRQQLERSEEQIALLSSRVEMNQSLLDHMESLKAQGHESEVEVIQQRDAVLALSQEHQNALLNRINLEESLSQLRFERAQAPIQHQTELDNLNLQKEESRRELLQMRHEREAEVRAPEAGRVSGMIAVDGQPVDPGGTLLHILPEDSRLQAVLHVPSRSIGMIQAGQSVRLRYDAFPYQRFGVYEGIITEVGTTAYIQGEGPASESADGASYRVVVALDHQEIPAYGQSFPLRPGMRLEADIVTENRTLIRWLFDPIFSVQRTL
ncbi:membrane fusion protein [Natronospira proteinivora]|uniref:Membrane fusion protein n=1 Tax=Natronospira proteinivora TaxID=1807133 RepID=A0ABT1GA82_9GAMM|nr:HlyD family efflux transporter periplasmic adaptor subunit [Natronospira proteinivora]MCP1728220.1 membrane fusion protein [Natronospira proteinivora]